MGKKTFKTLATNQIKTSLLVEKKKNVEVSRHVPTKNIKLNRTLYDSGWIDVEKKSDGPGWSGGTDKDGPESEQDPNAYGHVNYFKNLQTDTAPTANLNPDSDADPEQPYVDDYPLELFYSFNRSIDIPKKWIPFVQTQIMVKTPDDVKIKGVHKYEPAYYGNTYHEIKGDGGLIYKGTIPPTSSNSSMWQFQLDQGNVQSSYLSKWFIGEVSGTNMVGDFMEYKNTNMMEIITAYDVVFVPSAGTYNYKKFTCIVFDNITATSITGTGRYDVITWEETSPDVWNKNIKTILNVTKTVPIFDDSMKIVLKNGRKYRNGTYLGIVNDTFYVSEIISIHPFAWTDLINVTINFSHETRTLSGYDEPQKRWKLWYSTKRAHYFRFNNGNLGNVPLDFNYQNNTLPYATISVKSNHGNYPEPYKSSPRYYKGYKKEVWSEIDAHGDNNVVLANVLSGSSAIKNTKYQHFIRGTIQLTAPANHSIANESAFAGVDEVTWIDEAYDIQPNTYGENTYEKIAENRPPKIVPLFIASDHICQVRLLMTIANPMHTNTVENYNAQSL